MSDKTVVVNFAIISSFESVKKSGALKYYKLITVSLKINKLHTIYYENILIIGQ